MPPATPEDPPIAPPERATQERVIALLCHELHYRFLGNRADRVGNSNIEEGLLADWLGQRGHSPAQVSRALDLLRREARHPGRDLMGNNQAVYRLLRYGVPVKVDAGEPTQTVALIDWDHPEANDFAVAEEVTLQGPRERRPDLVLYVNGLALAVVELKNSRTSLGDGIRQSLSNQQPEFNAWFFSTVQFIFAGNDSEGLKYGSVGTPEKYYLHWKEDEADNAGYKLDKYLRKLCQPARLLELVHDGVLFDGGVKKLPRPHQYFGLKAAQARVNARQGGIIWHTQGAGKSILMVLLAQWILENKPQARVAIVTDRDELDKQIKRVFEDAGHTIYRTHSGRDLLAQLGQATPRLLCSLVHKFGRQGRGKSESEFDAFIDELGSQPAHTVGEVFAFVDECHRTQSGRLHRVMKALMPSAVFIGFTGTPLLKADQQTSREVFGSYIHTYKFSEAVADKVVLDLVYEARDIDQRLGSPERVDQWFEARTRGLNAWQRDELKKRWGTMQGVLSARPRRERVVSDVVMDFATRPRLMDGRGNAILVAASIFEACQYYTQFNQPNTGFKGQCALVTSYNPQARDVTLEETGANTETDKQFIYATYTELLKGVQALPGQSATETYEDAAKAQFIKQPASMKLLIVVQKLLTGFDAPPCTYLYIDKAMQDHGLFQAICRTNRLDGDSKDFGYIVDYKDLFKNLVNDKGTGALQVYSSELDHSAGGAEPQVLMQSRLQKGRERLDDALEALALVCEPVPPPRDDLAHIHHFCGNTEVATDLQQREPRRVALYKATASLLRAFGNLADELPAAGYTPADIQQMQARMKHYAQLRDIVRQASGETLDLKAYEADMRHLLDTYVQADEPRKISPFDGMGLLEIITRTGMDQAIATQLGCLQGQREAIAETIENNVRRKIIKESLTDPAYFARMSALLDEIIADRRAKAIEYEAYLQRIALLVGQVQQGNVGGAPRELNTPGQRAIYHFLQAWPQLRVAEGAGDAAALAQRLHAAIRGAAFDGWRGHKPREEAVKQAMFAVLGDAQAVLDLFPLVEAQQEY